MSADGDDDEPIMLMYTIMYDCLDIPGKYIVRVQEIYKGYTRPGLLVSVSNNIHFARLAIPPNYDTCIPRDPADEPQIVETWL